MRIEGKEYRTIWFENNVVKIIDQTKLPHQFIIKDLKTVKDAINAIKIMEVRGAPLIGPRPTRAAPGSAAPRRPPTKNSGRSRRALLPLYSSGRTGGRAFVVTRRIGLL